jgi:hypothetical protein
MVPLKRYGIAPIMVNASQDNVAAIYPSLELTLLISLFREIMKKKAESIIVIAAEYKKGEGDSL